MVADVKADGVNSLGLCVHGHVFDDRGSCFNCGLVVDLECQVCHAPITASQYETGERCDEHASPVFRQAFLTGRAELIREGRWPE